MNSAAERSRLSGKKKRKKKLTDFHRLTFNYPLLFFRSAEHVGSLDIRLFRFSGKKQQPGKKRNKTYSTLPLLLICMRHAFHIFFTCVLDAFASPAINFYLIVCVCCANRLYNSVSVKRVEVPASRMLASICRLIRTCCFALSPA